MELYVNPQITGFRQDVDGTIKELKIGSNKEDAWANIAEQGASAKLDNNKTATIDVSTYTEPVEITPTSGKDGMKKATVTLSNIPSPSGSNYKMAAVFETSLGYQDAIVFFETEDYPQPNTTVNVLMATSAGDTNDGRIASDDMYEGPVLVTVGEVGCGNVGYYVSSDDIPSTSRLKGIHSAYSWVPEP